MELEQKSKSEQTVGKDKKAEADSHEETIDPQSAYIIKPPVGDKFSSRQIKELIQQSLQDHLFGKKYDSEEAKKWTIDIANKINQHIKDLNLKRYKHIVQVTIGELNGAGVKSGLRCLWDSDTDGYISDIFMNETIFAVAVAFAIYLY